MFSQQQKETALQATSNPKQRHQQRHQEWYSVYKPESDTAAPDPLDPGKRYHDGIWVQHSPSTNKGPLFHVTGDVIAARGMRYEQRDEWTPGDSGSLHNLSFLGYVRREDYESGKVGKSPGELPTPSKQQGINFWEKDPVTGRHELIWTKADGEPYGPGEESRKVFKCNEWTVQAIERLKELGMLKDNADLGSFCGLVGQWGQANYAASNTFLDSFVQFRHSLGLSASAIDIGAIEDVGYVSQSPGVLEHFKSLHSLTLTEQELLDSVELAIKRSKPSQSFAGAFTNPSTFGIGLRSFKLLDDPACRLIWKRDIRFSIYRNLEQKVKTVESSQGGGLQSFYSMVDRDASYLLEPAALQMLALEIGKVLFGYLLRAEEDIRVDVKLDNLGIDSLVAIELKNWYRQHLNFETSVMTIMKCTLLELAQTAIDAIKDRRGERSISQAKDSMMKTDARQKWTQVLEMKAP